MWENKSFFIYVTSVCWFLLRAKSSDASKTTPQAEAREEACEGIKHFYSTEVSTL